MNNGTQLSLGTSSISVLLVDDVPSVTHGLRMCLALELDMTVVGEAYDGRSALVLAAEKHPDVVVMDLDMPGMDGAAATAALLSGGAHCSVVILSIHDDTASKARSLKAGAVAFVEKSAGVAKLLAAIRDAAPKGTPKSTGSSSGSSTLHPRLV